jgi:hypothetical protein
VSPSGEQNDPVGNRGDVHVKHLVVGLNLKETRPALVGTGRSPGDESLAQPLQGFGGMSARVFYFCCLCEVRYAVHE